jgi:hypothetical protein
MQEGTKMLDKIFPVIEYEETDPFMDYVAVLFYTGMLAVLISIGLFMFCVYVL